jgi:DNA-binding YbaB/EbfC family protein
MGSGFSKFKKQAKMLSAQYETMQEEMKNLHFTGSAGGGLVQMTLNGQHEILDLKIKPDCVVPTDVEGLQDLIRAAYQEAHQKIEAHKGDSQKQMPSMF